MGHPSERLRSIDWLRGIVMVLMALDHVRDYYGALANPLDVENASPALFFTRWITHFCAPVFVFLAGTSAWLQGARGRSRREVSRYLLSRGAFLIVLELTVVDFAWIGGAATKLLFWQVIAAIGTAMIALAALIHLPPRALLGTALGILCLHNALDPIEPASGRPGDLWLFVHEGSLANFRFVPIGDAVVLVIYPILPWIGVMALGYAFGPLTAWTRARRRRALLLLGGGATLLFVVVRGLDVYGDPVPWSTHESPVRTLMSFLNCQKYPPSLAFTLMTLGPALMVLALFDREPGPVGRASIVFGRVPLFYYVLHILVVRWSSELVHLARTGEPVSLVRAQFWSPGADFDPLPEGFTGLGLGGVYLAWILIVAALWPACRWYAGVKRAHPGGWTRYF